MPRRTDKNSDPMLVTYNTKRHSYQPYQYPTLTLKHGGDSGASEGGVQTQKTSSTPLILDEGILGVGVHEPLVTAAEYVNLVRQDEVQNEVDSDKSGHAKGRPFFFLIPVSSMKMYLNIKCYSKV